MSFFPEGASENYSAGNLRWKLWELRLTGLRSLMHDKCYTNRSTECLLPIITVYRTQRGQIAFEAANYSLLK